MSVYLVGAGPGDPDLLTVAALELLRRADVVVHDRLVDERTLSRCRPGAELVDVGKAPFGPGTTQEAINALLVARGRGELVVRLKGGDPFVFGRGGEEALALAAAGVDYAVVPGVSAALAAPAAAGVPLTLRGETSAFVVLTGHDPPGATSAAIDWVGLAHSEATLVVLMAAARHGEVAERLLAGGRSPATPVVVIESATAPEQASVRSTLGGLAALEVSSPATIVIGALAGLRLSSLEDRPLHGWRVLLTRAAGRSGPLSDALGRAGARPVSVPTIEIAPAPDGGRALAGALGELSSFSWVVLTSANAVDAVFAGLRDARAFGAARVAVAGPATARRLREHGIVADLVARPPSAAGLAACLPPPGRAGERALYPRAQRAPGSLADALSARGYAVTDPVAYATLPRVLTDAEKALAASADAAVLASPSALEGLLAALGPGRLPGVLVSIGATTSAALRRAGLEVAAEASTPEPAGLVAACVAAVASRLRPPRDDTHRAGRGRTGRLGP